MSLKNENKSINNNENEVSLDLDLDLDKENEKEINKRIDENNSNNQLAMSQQSESEKKEEKNESQTTSVPSTFTKVIDKVLEESGYHTYNLRIFIILSLFFLADGGEMIVISLIVNELETTWNLSSTQKGFVGSAVFIGFYIGTLIGGKLSDSKGRLITFTIGAVIVFIFGVISAFSPNYTFLIFMRGTFGLGVGMSIPSSTSLLTEITPHKYRSFVLTMVWFTFPFGEILAILFAKNLLVSDYGWRYLLFLVTVPAFFSIILTCFMIESPRFYYSKGLYHKASDCLDLILVSVAKSKLTSEERMQICSEGSEEMGKRRGSQKENEENEEKEGKNEDEVNDFHEITARISKYEDLNKEKLDLNKENHKTKENHMENKEIIEKNINDTNKIDNNELENEKDIREISKSIDQPKQKTGFVLLLTKRYLHLTLSVCYIFFTCSFVYYGIIYILPQNLNYIYNKHKIEEYLETNPNKTLLQTYIPDYNLTFIEISNKTQVFDMVRLLSKQNNFTKNEISHEKENGDMYNNLLLSVIVEIPSNFISIYLANHRLLGRKKSLAFTFIFVSFSTVFCVLFISQISLLGAILKFGISINFSIIYIYVCESYPTRIRSIGIGFSNSFNRMAGVITPILCQVLFNVDDYLPYVMFCFVSIIASIVSFKLPYETLGRKLEDS